MSPLDDAAPVWLDRLKQSEEAGPKPYSFKRLVSQWKRAYKEKR